MLLTEPCNIIFFTSALKKKVIIKRQTFILWIERLCLKKKQKESKTSNKNKIYFIYKHSDILLFTLFIITLEHCI